MFCFSFQYNSNFDRITENAVMTTQAQFKLYPGIGYLFRNGGPKDHPLFQGPINLGDQEYQLRGHYDFKRQAYQLELVEFDTWKPRMQLTLGKPKAEIRRTKLVHEGKKLTLEAIKATTRTGTPCLMFRVPELIRKPREVF